MSCNSKNVTKLDKCFEIWNDVNQTEFVEVYVCVSHKSLGRVLTEKQNLIMKTQCV